MVHMKPLRGFLLILKHCIVFISICWKRFQSFPANHYPRCSAGKFLFNIVIVIFLFCSFFSPSYITDELLLRQQTVCDPLNNRPAYACTTPKTMARTYTQKKTNSIYHAALNSTQLTPDFTKDWNNFAPSCPLACFQHCCIIRQQQGSGMESLEKFGPFIENFPITFECQAIEQASQRSVAGEGVSFH